MVRQCPGTMTGMTSEDMLPEELLTSRLHEAGLRLTLPRRLICRVLAESDEAFLSASMILDGVNDIAGTVDASTVYRTLGELARVGVVHQIHLGNARAGMWHLTLKQNHEHLICERCRETIEVPRADFGSLFDMLLSKYGFRPSPHHFAFLGLCGKCAEVRRHDHTRAETDR